jgi:cold-inducible RNA-binding protein
LGTLEGRLFDVSPPVGDSEQHLLIVGLGFKRYEFGLVFSCARLSPGRPDGLELCKENGMKNLFVGNMSFQTTEGDLRGLFEGFGQVARVHIAMDRETGRSRGFAFVEMPNDAEAAQAIAGLDGKDLGGRNLKVNEARPKEAGAPRGPRPGGDRGGSERGGNDRGGNDRGGNRGGSDRGGGGRGRFSNEDYREAARQPREPRW